MIKNSSRININGTQIALINIGLITNGDQYDIDSKLLEAGLNFVESIKLNTFDWDRPINVQQGSVACFGLLITHLGEQPSPFWFQKYKRFTIKSFKIHESSGPSSDDSNRYDMFDSKAFPNDRCLVNEDDDGFILHLKFIGINVKNSSIGDVINFELEASHDDSRDASNKNDHFPEPFQHFKLKGEMIVIQTLQVDGFVKNNRVFIKLKNLEESMDIEIEDMDVNRDQIKGGQVSLPFKLSSGNQMNISVTMNDEIDERWSKQFEHFVPIFIKWNLCQNLSKKYSLSTNLEIKWENETLKDIPISITCSIKEIKNFRLTLEIKVKVMKKMELYLRMLDHEEPTHYKKLIPLHDIVELGVVDIDEIKSYSLYFYYVTEGLHQSPKIEVKDKTNDKLYKIENKVFSVDTDCLNQI